MFLWDNGNSSPLLSTDFTSQRQANLADLAISYSRAKCERWLFLSVSYVRLVNLG